MRDDQQKIELPICVTSEDKILSVLSISPKTGERFKRGQIVTVECRMTIDKLLEIAVTVEGRQTVVEQLNPLSNTALTLEESKFLFSRQRFNKAVLDGNGKPPVSEVIVYARAASDAGRFLRAAELFEQVECMDSSRNFAVSICWNYDRAARSEEAEKWAEIAYDRGKSTVTAFNVAVFKHRSGKIDEAQRYLEESIAHDSEYAAALVFLGEILEAKNQSGQPHLQLALRILKNGLRDGTIEKQDCWRLARVARSMGDTQLASRAELAAKKMGRNQSLYDEDHLVGIAGKVPMASKD